MKRRPLVLSRQPAAMVDVGCLARYFTRMHFPMTKPPADMLSYTRRDGKREMRLVGDPKYGLPYGSDLVALYGLCTRGREAIQKYGRNWNGKISFSSTAEMLRYFGEPPTQYYYRRRMESLLRLWGARIVFEDTIHRATDTMAEQKHFSKTEFLCHVTAWFQLDDRQIGMPFKNEIEFSPSMQEWIRRAPIFEDRVIFELKQSVGMLQLYVLLRDRCSDSSLRDRRASGEGWLPIHGPQALESQLGWLHQPEPREVRRLIGDWLDGIRSTVWPECPGEVHRGRDGAFRLLVEYVPPLFKP